MESTIFANSKKRIIHKSAKGVFHVMSAEGKKVYKPKAFYKKKANGSMVVLKRSTAVPKAIAKAPAVRKVRSNKGVARGPRTPTEAALFRKIFGTPKPKAVSTKVKAMVVSPKGTVYKSKAAMMMRQKMAVKKALVNMMKK
jgi:hypothetical protein